MLEYLKGYQLIQLPKECLEPVVEIQLTDEDARGVSMLATRVSPGNLSMISHYCQGRSSQCRWREWGGLSSPLTPMFGWLGVSSPC